MSSSPPTAEQADAAALSELARQLFDAAAVRWYSALAIEAAAGLVAASLGLLVVDGDPAIIGSLLATSLLIIGYAGRLWGEDAHDAAETMRRQAAVSEGLGWPLDRVQLSDWRRKAGRRLRARVDEKPRSSDYYSSPSPPGPRRMAEATAESAFYTRNLQLWMRKWITLAIAGAAGLLIVAMYLSLTRVIPDSLDRLVAQVVSVVVPLAVTVNLVGWSLSLGRTASAIRSVEGDLERLLGTTPTEGSVLRLVAEYDCQLAKALPVHPSFFALKHDELRELWLRRFS